MEWLPPAFASPFRQALGLLDGNVEALMKARVYIEYLQEMYFARFALEIDRKLFNIFIEFGWLTEEFTKFGQDFTATSIWTDPLGRLESIHDLPIDKPREGPLTPPSAL
jgi:hypothetical protein